MPHSYPLTDKPAPPFSLPDANGQTYTLNPESVGRPVIIFFYPKSGMSQLGLSSDLGSLTTCCMRLGTYGCTKEACEFRDALVGTCPKEVERETDYAYRTTERESFKTTKAQVIGISSDPVEKQKEFVEKNKLTVRNQQHSMGEVPLTLPFQYPVLSDSGGEARKAYHIGKGLLGLVEARVTVVIDTKGIVR